MNQPQVPTVPASPARVPRDCRVGGEPHVGHGDTGQVQQALEYRGDTHAFRPSRLGSGSSTEPNGHRVRVTPAPEPHARTLQSRETRAGDAGTVGGTCG